MKVSVSTKASNLPRAGMGRRNRPGHKLSPGGKAAEWYRKAAEQGLAAALANLNMPKDHSGYS